MATETGLDGDVLLVLTMLKPSDAWFQKVQAKFPGLRVRWEPSNNDKGMPKAASEVPKDAWEGVTILATYSPVPASLIPNVRFVQVVSAGSDLWANNEIYLNKEVLFATGSGTQPPQIAEWVISTWLASQHNLYSYVERMKKGVWEADHISTVDDSVGRRMGVLGYGSIGRQIARVAAALGTEVYAFTARERPTSASRRDDGYSTHGLGDPEGTIPAKWFYGTTKEAVNEFLSQDLDILVISMPLTKSSYRLIGPEQFAILSKKRTFVSNIARGPIVDTDALIEALEKGQIKGAALDVTDPEPLPEGHPLWKAPNLLITPHVSWHSSTHWDRVFDVLAENLENLASHRPLVNRLDR